MLLFVIVSKYGTMTNVDANLVDKMVCNKGFSWNPSNCKCECDNSCGTGEYLNFKNCVCKKTLFDKLVEECTSVIEENKIYNETLDMTYRVIALLVQYALLYS